MDTHSYLEKLITEMLGGDKRRVFELFKDEDVYQELVALDNKGGWLNYRENLYDGWHMIKHLEFYDVYYQERGVSFERRRFKILKEAAEFFYTESGFVGS
ncbi:hypothetical protein [Stutzerimonas zhaodongensis]|uniref:hypothetical protein n=1 Tax=Stutzerimonas zhaodongensis TaxID=1176257 RepID=UPI00210328CB|nr:hypothetical protein [Stutzerimonas zhaodongensis]MCQ2032289.1 hypothetical protein [Stutzerimonas zhaodongensis]